MAEQIGIITEDQRNGWAIVVSDRRGGCGGCHPGGGCHSCLSGMPASKIVSRAANPINARTGDIVRIRLRSSDLFKGAFILYLIPVLGLMAGAVLGAEGTARFGWPHSIAAIAGATVGLVLGVMIVAALDRSRYVRRTMVPTITEVVSSAQQTHLPVTQSSCCS